MLNLLDITFKNAIFNDWTTTQLKDLYLSTFRINYNQNDIIFKEDD